LIDDANFPCANADLAHHGVAELVQYLLDLNLLAIYRVTWDNVGYQRRAAVTDDLLRWALALVETDNLG